jgi:uncharacterized protein YqeY
MVLADQLQEEIKNAMRAKDAERLNALRMLKSAVGYVQIEKKTDALSEAEFIAVVQREVKKRRDSAEQFTTGGRPELAAKENAKPLSAEDLETLVRATIQEVGATDKKQMGAVMKAVQTKAAGRADGKTISGIVAKLLP